ncbi:MAG: hypothetical protein NC299_07105 [Lachnospiraceae bacterium]|nr:hypothetical protein [Ruminococcus sp.]MCM1275122.1 hypothetical protein [Lachnospiraceae bacterium]
MTYTVNDALRVTEDVSLDGDFQGWLREVWNGDIDMGKFGIVKKAIDTADSYGLLGINAPSDEYDFESVEIADKISENSSAEEIGEIAAEVFSRRFNAVFTADKFTEAAKEIRREFDTRERKIL